MSTKQTFISFPWTASDDHGDKSDEEIYQYLQGLGIALPTQGDSLPIQSWDNAVKVVAESYGNGGPKLSDEFQALEPLLQSAIVEKAGVDQITVVMWVSSHILGMRKQLGVFPYVANR